MVYFNLLYLKQQLRGMKNRTMHSGMERGKGEKGSGDFSSSQKDTLETTEIGCNASKRMASTVYSPPPFPVPPPPAHSRLFRSTSLNFPATFFALLLLLSTLCHLSRLNFLFCYFPISLIHFIPHHFAYISGLRSRSNHF